MFGQSIFSRLIDYSRPDSFANRLRRRRVQGLIDLIDHVRQTQETVSIVDIGGTKAYWNIIDPKYLRDNRVHITLVNLPGAATPVDDDLFRSVEGDGCELTAFSDRSFDIAHSNSVIEHVGGWENMERFARETRRVARHYFVQTPNFWFPIEPHFFCPFFHWLPLPTRAFLLTRFWLGRSAPEKDIAHAVRRAEEISLLNYRMFVYLFDDAELHFEKWLLLNKSIIAIRKVPNDLLPSGSTIEQGVIKGVERF